MFEVLHCWSKSYLVLEQHQITMEKLLKKLTKHYDERLSEHNKLSKQKAKWTTPHEYQQHKIYVCICTPFTFYNVLMIISSFTMTHLKTGPQQRT